MNILIFFSIFVKLLGSVMEIGSQSLISQLWSVETYGTYSFFISLVEVFYSLFFSAIIKFNNYYIPRGENVKPFKKKLYLYYAIPILIAGLGVSVSFRSSQLFVAIFAGFLYFCSMDTSSKMMSYGRYKSALFGEYCIGRFFVVVLIALITITPSRRNEYLYLIYVAQYIAAILYYYLCNKKKPFKERRLVALDPNARKKLIIFQATDIGHMIIMQSSVIVQYFFGGAYQTALVSIVLVVRKLINFITGPTSKLYQPEFSKRYNVGDIKGLGEVYAQITRTQLCVMMPAFTFLIAKPGIILSIFNKSLAEHGSLVRWSAAVFLFMILFGPLTNFLCMTGHEKSDTVSNWISIAVMYLTMCVLKSSLFFVVYGFCAQIIFSTIYKLIVYLTYMRQLTMPIGDYLKLFFIFAFCLVLMLLVPDKLLLIIAICTIQFVADFGFVLPKAELSEFLGKVKGVCKR